MTNKEIFDAELTGVTSGEFSEKILFEIQDGQGSTVLSILWDVIVDMTYTTVDENGMPIQSSTPRFTIGEAEFRKAVNVEPNVLSEEITAVFIRRLKYRVERCEPDGQGMLVIYIMKAKTISDAELAHLVAKGL